MLLKAISKNIMVLYLYHDNTTFWSCPSIIKHNNKCYYHGPICRNTMVLYGIFCTFYCNFVTSSMIMIINMKCVFWTGTLGAVNMRVSGRRVVWRSQQWSSVTIIHSKPSRYIHSSPKYSLNVLFKVILFTCYRFSPWLKSVWVCWSRIGYFRIGFFFVYCVNNNIFSFNFYCVTCLECLSVQPLAVQVIHKPLTDV